MGERGITLPDSVVLVGGAAVASSLERSAFPWESIGFHGLFFWWTLAGVAVSVVGPLVYLGGCLGRRPRGYLRSGDCLWT